MVKITYCLSGKIRRCKMKQFKLKNSGEGNQDKHPTGSVRDSREGKGRYDLIPPGPLRRLAIVYELGSRRYGDGNWQKGMPLRRYLDSAFRHLMCLYAGEPIEDNAAQCCWNLFAYMWTLNEIEYGRLPKELDD